MMLAPMTLPTERSDCFLMIAVIVVISSGREVPIATIVIAIIFSGTPSSVAKAVPLSTKN